jgi:hypothetical protein
MSQPPGPPPASPPQSPAQQWPTPSQPASPYAYTASPGYGTPPPKKSGSGLIIGAIVGVVLFGIVTVVAIVALSGGSDDKPSAHETTTAADNSGGSPSGSGSPVTTDPALTLRGTGYSYQLPDSDWKDITDSTPDDTGTIDSIAAPGTSISTARGTVLVEESSAFGQTDVNQLTGDWKDVLEQSTGATPTDIGSRDIGGKPAVGVELKWTNTNSFDVHQIAYLVVSGDNQYSITASFRQGDNGFKDTFYGILDTWHWDE